MPEPSTLLIFLFAAWLVILAPGPAVLYIVARSVDQGRTAGLISTLGVAAGCLVHIGAAALGVSVILASSPFAFNALKYLGAAYLIYLGIRRLLTGESGAGVHRLERQRLSRVFRDGAIVNILNPKTALFFLAFLPQFIDPSRGTVATQMLLLGGLFVTLGVLSDALWALCAAAFAQRFVTGARLGRVQRYFSGSVLIVLGVATALMDFKDG